MQSISAITSTTICYALLFLLTFYTKQKGSESLSVVLQHGCTWKYLHLRHMIGIFLMIIVPVIGNDLIPFYLLEFPHYPGAFILSFLLVYTGLLIHIGYNQSVKQPVNFTGSRGQAILYAFVRTIFLVSYEWFFRGILLTSFAILFGFVPAIACNLVLYSIIHLANSKREAICCIPFGLILCILTLWLKSIWPAVFLHLALSYSYELPTLFVYSKKSKLAL